MWLKKNNVGLRNNVYENQRPNRNFRHDLVAKIVAAYDRAAGKLAAAKAEKAEKKADGKADVKE